MAEEYVPFEKALADLRLNEDELRRLVSEDEIQAIRDDEGRIRLRREDVERLAQGAQADELAEDLVFADEAGDDDTGMVTAVLEDDSLLEEETLDLEEDDLLVPASPPAARSAPRAAPLRSRSRAAVIRGNGDGPEHESTFDRVLTIATAVFLVYAVFVAQSIAAGRTTGLTRWLADMFKT